jgi:hypothetical protein
VWGVCVLDCFSPDWWDLSSGAHSLLSTTSWAFLSCCFSSFHDSAPVFILWLLLLECSLCVCGVYLGLGNGVGAMLNTVKEERSRKRSFFLA